MPQNWSNKAPWLLGFVAIALSSCNPSGRPATVSTTHPMRQNLASWVSSNGKVEPIDAYVVQSQLTTFIEKVSIKQGDKVGRGQTLMTLDAKDLQSELAKAKGVTIAFETGQETADLLRLTLDDLKCPNLKVNFDPANMLLYDKGDPIRAVEILGPDIRSVHVKDANRPKVPGQWGEEVPLGRGQANIKQFVTTLKKVGYRGPLCIEREVGDQAGRIADIAHGIRFLKECLA